MSCDEFTILMCFRELNYLTILYYHIDMDILIMI